MSTHTGESALVANVLGTSAAQQQLVPALMRVYGQADFVVGLDVDKDDYDKFSVSQILVKHWSNRQSTAVLRMVALCTSQQVQ